MTATAWTRAILFLSSYSPLFALLGMKAFSEVLAVGILLVALSVLSVVFLVVFLRLINELAPHAIHVAQARSRDVEVIGYLIAYLLPFLDISFTDVVGALSLGVFILIVAVLYVHSNMIHVNPVLNLLGYHILEVESEEGKTSALISRRRYIRSGTTLNVASLGDYVLLECGT